MERTTTAVQAFTWDGHRTYSVGGEQFAVAEPIAPHGPYRIRPVGETAGPTVRSLEAADVIASRWAAEGVR